MEPFDVLVIETSYLTTDNLKLFLISYVKHFKKLADCARLVIAINSGDDDEEKRSSLRKEIHSICKGYNVYVFECNRVICEKWRAVYGPNARPDLVNLSHGHVIHEYLENHSAGVAFTLLCHSDVEFLEDMSDTISSRQRILQDPLVAAVASWEFPPSGILHGDQAIAECMDSICSMWKTPILSEFAINRKIELGGVDLRKHGGLFYDTGAFLQAAVKKEFRVVRKEAPVKHWGGVTSILLSAGPVEWYKEMMSQVRERILEYNDV